MSKIQNHGFQAEVKQLLDIVIHSLYTDSEIFVRELVSNASDSLEKLKLKQLTEKNIYDGDKGLEIQIETNEEENQIIITDTGIGMNREELTENLGTIAHSGTKSFLNALKEKGGENGDVIGQFGVGFYSAFMVADKVDVETHSWDEGAESLKWSSDGVSGYTIEDVEDVARGAKMTIYLKEENKEFAKPDKIKSILEKYSNFVSFPVLLNGERVNNVDALWLKSKSEITDEQYVEFYKFVAHAWDEPRYTMHFSADAPLSINALLFAPNENQEQFGMGQMDAGVSLYCRKVLIDSKPKGLLPEWLRFLKGVVDSADLPLNISRESMQDSALIQKLNKLITKRFLKFLDKQSKDDSEKYIEFYSKFGRFIKEGIATSFEHQEQLTGLLRFNSSMSDEGQMTSFSEYLDRAPEDQSEIYYIVGKSISGIEAGPYIEAFKKRGIEVAYFTDQVDQYVFDSLPEYKGKKLVSIDREDIELKDVEDTEESLDEGSSEALIKWMSEELEGRVDKVEASNRLTGSPVMALTPKDAPNAQMRSMMQAMGQDIPEQKVTLQINTSHQIVKNLFGLHSKNEDLAKLVSQQLVDNALMSAGLVENPHELVTRMNEMLAEITK